MKRKIFNIIVVVLLCITLTGCKKNDNKNESKMSVYTSVYPTEYILEKLYGNKMGIQSIYPVETNYETYKLSSTMIENYSNGDLYVYNGTIAREKNYAVKMINNNKKLKIIDASQGMTHLNNPSEAWLNPTSFLMMASNIKKGLEEYINENIEIRTIEQNYKDLKLELSIIDAELKSVSKNARNNTIIVSNDSFKYLDKYGFNVISIEENENLTDKIIFDVKKMFENKEVSYIFVKDNEKESNLIKDLKDNYNAEVVSLNSLTSLKPEEKENGYQSIMINNISLIKKEVSN